jgi:hypothetical protein
MAELVTLELPENVVQRAREAAERTGRPLEGVLADWLERASGVSQTSGDAQPERSHTNPVLTPYGN